MLYLIFFIFTFDLTVNNHNVCLFLVLFLTRTTHVLKASLQRDNSFQTELNMVSLMVPLPGQMANPYIVATKENTAPRSMHCKNISVCLLVKTSQNKA